MNNQKPKTIKISLADGEPTGTKIVELSNWTGIAYLIPRNRLENTLNNPENRENLNSQCVYFLIGDSEENQKTVYVGEAEEFSKRIIRHIIKIIKISGISLWYLPPRMIILQKHM
ncbi:MAG: hypothetical protein N3A71_01360 [Candidatus Dojkabacteria bacterium]|nr:hypothetical protein [Candidatus Dojkabacteria bacterium]